MDTTKLDITDDNIQPILAVGIDCEKSTFTNMVFRVEEIEEGIISYLTIKEIEYLVKDLIPHISEEEYNYFVKNTIPLLYLIYDIEEVSVYLSPAKVVEKIENYEGREKKILQCAKRDFSIV